jgi:hypothetical protein
MSKVSPILFAAMLVLGAGSAARAHGGGGGGHGGGGGFHGGGGGMHMSSFHSSPSFHSSSFSSFHSSPSFHSSSFSSFHSAPSSSFDSSFGSSHSSGFGSFGSGSHHSEAFPSEHNTGTESSFNSGSGMNSGFGSHHSDQVQAQSGVNNDGASSHHGGFPFFGHHNQNSVNAIAGGSLANGNSMSANSMSDHHHGFLFFGHHNQNAAMNGDPNQVMAMGHHHHQNYYNMNTFNMSPANANASSLVINMAPPPIANPMPIHSLSITKYFYAPPPQPYYPSNFGSYGASYGGYGYSPVRGMSMLLFRMLSMIGFGPRYGNAGGLGSSAFLGTFGPMSSFNSGNPTDDGATNFVDNYNNFNYQGGAVGPFANMLPDTASGGTDMQPVDPDANNMNGQNMMGQNPDPQGLSAAQSLLALNPDPQINGMDPQNQADSLNPADQIALSQAMQHPVDAFEQPKFTYHYQGVLGSAFVHKRALPANSYKAPELLGIIFTHQFWDKQNQQQDGDTPPTDPVTAQN